MRFALVSLLLSLVLALGSPLKARAQVYPEAPLRANRLTMSACLQYQVTKHYRGRGVSPFRRYGFHAIANSDSTKVLWGYHVSLDSVRSDSKPLYRSFKHRDLTSIGIIDDFSASGICQYVFWWKGYYRRFSADLKRMGFVMSNDKRHSNVLIFSRNDVSVTVKFIIWDDIYVMQLQSGSVKLTNHI